MLNKYKILEKVGSGGMGVVYKALDLKLGRIVAIKELILNEALAPKERENCIARFKREAETASMLSHPNIVAVYDFGEYENRHFISMEFLKGKSLKDYLNDNYNFSLDELINYFIQTSEGLEYAHSMKIIHRDIKPANIQIPNINRVKITDFGLARSENSSSTLTQDGTMFGTIGYMSPEQLKNSKKVDFRADIYSFGAMMYELITGRLPFSGDSIPETIYKILYLEPEAIKDTYTDVPEPLEMIVNNCMKKNFEERYQNTGEIVRDLKLLSSKYGQIIISNPKKETSQITETIVINEVKSTNPLNVAETQKLTPEENLLNQTHEFLQNGQKFVIKDKLESETFSLCIDWESPSDYEIEPCVLMLSESEKLEKEENFIFYNNLYSVCKSIIIDSSENQIYKKLIDVDISKIPDDVNRIKFFLSIDNSDSKDKVFANVKNIIVSILTQKKNDIFFRIQDLTTEVTLVVAEIYKRKNQWKFQACSDGYISNLGEFLKKHASEKIVIENN